MFSRRCSPPGATIRLLDPMGGCKDVGVRRPTALAHFDGLGLLASIAVPLRRALLQVASETRTRGEVQKALKRLVPSNAIVSQQVSIGKDEIVIRLISTRYIPNSKVAEVRQELIRQTGQDVQLSVEAVASRGELAELRARLERPASLHPRENTVGETQKR